MAEFDLAVLGATIVEPLGRRPLHLYVRDGRVAAVSPERLPATAVVDASGLHLLPGMVDTHVHFMDPGATEREDFPSGTRAAAASGVTTIVEHTHAHPVRSVEGLRDKAAHLRDRAWVDYGLAAHVWPCDLGGLAALYRAGVTFFKLFTCTTHGVPALDAAALWSAFQELARIGAPCLVHCEDDSLTALAERLLRAAGRADNAIVTEWRNREAELVAAHTAAVLARASGVRATLAHVSHPEVAAIVSRARAQGADLAAEACPQYFLLREQDVLTEGALRKFTPPARARTDDDERRMWRLLRAGGLSFMSTDHAPSTRQQKSAGSIWDAHFGLPGIDTTLALLLDAAARGLLALEDVARCYAAAPARRYGLYPRKGSLEIGADADLVLVDTTARRVLGDRDILSRAGWTPYAGRELRGRVTAVFLRGQRVAADRVVDGPPRGRFLAP